LLESTNTNGMSKKEKKKSLKDNDPNQNPMFLIQQIANLKKKKKSHTKKTNNNNITTMRVSLAKAG